LGLGEVSPGIGRNALPCSPRHSDSSHIQCIAGDQRSQVRRKCLGAIHQFSTLPAGRFPNFSASSPPTLSSVIFPQPPFHPLISLLQGAATSPCYCGLDVRILSSPPPSLLSVSSPVPPPAPPTPRLCLAPSSLSSALQVQLRPHPPTLEPLSQPPPQPPGLQSAPQVAPEVSLFTQNCR